MKPRHPVRKEEPPAPHGYHSGRPGEDDEYLVARRSMLACCPYGGTTSRSSTTLRREAEVSRCFPRAPYACFAVMNRFGHLLVLEKNRVFIDEEFWWRIKENLDRPVRGPEILLRFATSQ